MILNAQQESVAEQFEAFLRTLTPRYDPPHPGATPSIFYIGGYAGTGKTTMLTEIASAADRWLDDYSELDGCTRIAAPTNKAAKRLREKIERDATTLHYLLGASPVTHITAHIPALEEEIAKLKEEQEEEKGEHSKAKIAKLEDIVGTLRIIEELETQLESASGNSINTIANRIQALQEKLTEFPMKGSSLGYNDIVICDESSMVGIDLRDKIYARTPLAVAWVGDPGQLDPVKSPRWFEPPPQATLTKVMRQGADSGVLTLATMIRERSTCDTDWLARHLRNKSDVEFVFARKGDVVDWNRLADEYGDRWLTWRNGFKTRNHQYHTRKLNELYRYTKGFESPYPQAGDRLYITNRYINRCKSAKRAGVWLSKGEECTVQAAGGFNEEIADSLALHMAKATQEGFARSYLSAKTRTQLDLMGKKPSCICGLIEEQDGVKPAFCNGRVGFHAESSFNHPWGEIARSAQGIHALVRDERGTDFWTLLDPSDLLWNDDQRSEIWRVDQHYARECGGDVAQSRSPVKSLLKASYAYCISIHQSQGSEFPAVTVYWDAAAARMDPKNAVRLLYTAVTRASDRICIVTI